MDIVVNNRELKDILLLEITSGYFLKERTNDITSEFELMNFIQFIIALNSDQIIQDGSFNSLLYSLDDVFTGKSLVLNDRKFSILRSLTEFYNINSFPKSTDKINQFYKEGSEQINIDIFLRIFGFIFFAENSAITSKDKSTLKRLLDNLDPKLLPRTLMVIELETDYSKIYKTISEEVKILFQEYYGITTLIISPTNISNKWLNL